MPIQMTFYLFVKKCMVMCKLSIKSRFNFAQIDLFVTTTRCNYWFIWMEDDVIDTSVVAR